MKNQKEERGLFGGWSPVNPCLTSFRDLDQWGFHIPIQTRQSPSNQSKFAKSTGNKIITQGHARGSSSYLFVRKVLIHSLGDPSYGRFEISAADLQVNHPTPPSPPQRGNSCISFQFDSIHREYFHSLPINNINIISQHRDADGASWC